MLTWLFLALIVAGMAWGTTYYLVGLTMNEEVALRRLKNRDLYARHTLHFLKAPEFQPFWVEGSMLARRDFCRTTTLYMLRNLASDLEELGATGWRFSLGTGVFYVVYGLTWCKAQLWPAKDDIRGAIGVQLLMVQ